MVFQSSSSLAKIASVHHQQQTQPHHMPPIPSPLMFSTGPAATSSVNISNQSNSSSRLHFTPFCLPTIDTQSSNTAPSLSSSSPLSMFHPSNECSSSANTTAILFGNQPPQQQPSPSLYARYSNGSFRLIILFLRLMRKISLSLSIFRLRANLSIDRKFSIFIKQPKQYNDVWTSPCSTTFINGYIFIVIFLYTKHV